MAEQYLYLDFPGGSAVKNGLAMQEIGVWSRGQEDPLEQDMATHSSILAWSIPGTEAPGRLQSIGSDTAQRLKNHHHIPTYGEATLCFHWAVDGRLGCLHFVEISNKEQRPGTTLKQTSVSSVTAFTLCFWSSQLSVYRKDILFFQGIFLNKKIKSSLQAGLSKRKSK